MRLDGVGKRYGVRAPWVISDVSLEIRPGDLIRLEGGNGTGKSTLARVIAGATEPSRGNVTGRPETGFVPERFPPALPFTGRDYLRHMGRIRGLTGRELDSRIDRWLDRLGGGEHSGHLFRNMSKGSAQKFAIAQALLPRGGLLVLDEAWTGLDSRARGALDDAVAERLEDGGSVIFINHYSENGHLPGTRRYRLDAGRLIPAEARQGSAAVGEEDERA